MKRWRASRRCRLSRRSGSEPSRAPFVLVAGRGMAAGIGYPGGALRNRLGVANLGLGEVDQIQITRILGPSHSWTVRLRDRTFRRRR